MVVLGLWIVDLGFSKVVVPDGYVLTHLTYIFFRAGVVLGEEAVIPMLIVGRRVAIFHRLILPSISI